MKKEKGFTLVELLSVVVILGVTFMFVLPKMVGLISDSEDKETKLIEERVLSAAKDYVNHIDGSFYTKLYKEGDTNYIYKTDLINAGLIEEEEINKLDTLGGVKGELLSNDKIKYTVEYINASPSEYTNEELYLMIQNITNNGGGSGGNTGGSIDTSIIDDLQSQINDLKDKNSFLDAYPVGSVYISTSNTNPSTIGGTWVSFGTGRTLVGVDASQTEFASVEKAGGEKTHTLTVDEMPSHTHIQNPHTHSLGAPQNGIGSWAGWIYDSIAINSVDVNALVTSYEAPTNQNTGGSQPHNNLQPYITVYMWKRTA